MLNLSITLVIIVNYLCTMHREYHDFYGVHVYLALCFCVPLVWQTFFLIFRRKITEQAMITLQEMAVFNSLYRL